MHNGLKELLVCRNDMEAHIVRGLLEENEIDIYIQKDDCGGMEPQLQLTEGIKILVPSAQFEQAKQLLAELNLNDDDAGKSAKTEWKCPNCGEILEGQFTECWQCGTSRLQDETAK